MRILTVDMFLFFFFNDAATPEIYTLSLHDALPISRQPARRRPGRRPRNGTPRRARGADRKSTRLNSSHTIISYAVFCFKKKNELLATRASELLGGPPGGRLLQHPH